MMDRRTGRKMGARALAGALALLLALTWALPALADGPEAAAWLQGQQNADGGFGTPESAMGATADVLLAAAATGQNGLEWATDGVSALDYMQDNVGSLSKAGETAKVVLGLIASGKNPRDLGGVDLIAKLRGMESSDGKLGTETDMLNDHFYTMLALSSAQQTVPQSAIDYVLARQIEDGTWAWNGDTTAGGGDNNTAAMAVMALIAAGVPQDHPQIQKTLAHFAGQQNEDGGFPYINPSPYGTDSDANSTATVIWAILAAGQDPAGNDWKYQGQDGKSAMDQLQAFQNESGAFRWQSAMPDDNLASTVQAAVAIELKTLPLAQMDTTLEIVPISAPETLPVTGASYSPGMWLGALALLAGGITLIGAGWSLRRRA